MESHINPEQQSALQAANESLRETIKNFPFGSSNIHRVVIHACPLRDQLVVSSSHQFFAHVKSSEEKRNVDALIDDDLNALMEKYIAKFREDIKKIIDQTEGMPIETRRHTVRNILAKKASAYGMGNCDELATFAFLNVIENNYSGKVEFVSFQDLDHVFVVLNRPAESKADDWRTWGENTVILDPWINQVFTADRFSAVWKQNPWQMAPESIKIKIKFDDTSFRPAPHSNKNQDDSKEPPKSSPSH